MKAIFTRRPTEHASQKSFGAASQRNYMRKVGNIGEGFRMYFLIVIVRWVENIFTRTNKAFKALINAWIEDKGCFKDIPPNPPQIFQESMCKYSIMLRCKWGFHPWEVRSDDRPEKRVNLWVYVFFGERQVRIWELWVENRSVIFVVQYMFS